MRSPTSLHESLAYSPENFLITSAKRLLQHNPPQSGYAPVAPARPFGSICEPSGVQWLSRLNTLCGPLRSLQNAVADVRRTSIWSGYSRHLETTVARKLMP